MKSQDTPAVPRISPEIANALAAHTPEVRSRVLASSNAPAGGGPNTPPRHQIPAAVAPRSYPTGPSPKAPPK